MRDRSYLFQHGHARLGILLARQGQDLDPRTQPTPSVRSYTHPWIQATMCVPRCMPVRVLLSPFCRNSISLFVCLGYLVAALHEELDDEVLVVLDGQIVLGHLDCVVEQPHNLWVVVLGGQRQHRLNMLVLQHHTQRQIVRDNLQHTRPSKRV
jgi:hypothetical protein